MIPLLLLACSPKSADSDRPRPDSQDSAADDSTGDSAIDSTAETGDDSDSGDSDPADSGSETGDDTASTPPCTECTADDADEAIPWLGTPMVVQGELYFELNAEYVPTSGWAGGLLWLDGRERPSRTVDVDGDGVRDILCGRNTAFDSAFVHSGATGAQLSAIPYSALPEAPNGDFFLSGDDAILVAADMYDALVYDSADVSLSTPLATVQVLAYHPIAVIEADMTGDGVEDHVFSAAGYPDEFGNGGAWVIDGTERGSLSVEEDAYASFVATTESVRSGQYVRAVSSPVDLNKDGYLDLPVQDSGLSVYDVHAGGEIDFAAALSIVQNAYGGALLEFDGDGVEDVVAHTYESDGSYEQGFSVMFGVPSGTSDFRADATWRMSTPSWSQVTLDANDDGADDIVFGAVSSAGDINGIFYGGPER